MFGGLPESCSLRAIDVLLALEIGLGDIFLADKLRIAGRNVHGDIVNQFFEIVGAGHKIALAVHFDQHADLTAGVNSSW